MPAWRQHRHVRHKSRRRRRKPLLTPARLGIYAFLLVTSAFFLLPLYVMLTTSFKSLDDIREGNIDRKSVV